MTEQNKPEKLGFSFKVSWSGLAVVLGIIIATITISGVLGVDCLACGQGPKVRAAVQELRQCR